jgi:hypothetical protein
MGNLHLENKILTAKGSAAAFWNYPSFAFKLAVR